MNTFLKYPENTAFIICRIVFRRGRRQEAYSAWIAKFRLSGAEEE